MKSDAPCLQETPDSACVTLPIILCILALLFLLAGCTDQSQPEDPGDGIAPFTNIAPEALGKKAFTINRYPGVAIFDYDRDGDLDFYVTQEEGGPNFLFRNDGDSGFSEVSEGSGAAAVISNSTGVAACDFDNDGYQDLYVGAHGRKGDGLDYRSADESDGLRTAISDRLYLNRGDGTFEDITSRAFGDSVNIRSAMSVACADVDGDGWLDIYVANRADFDFVRFTVPQHHGHYNVLYRNNGDLTFSNISEEAGARGGQITMRAPDGLPIEFYDRESGEFIEGYDPRLGDRFGNRVGDPTGQSWATLFFDHDDDGDPDLWVAHDGDHLEVYRNDTNEGTIAFTPIASEMGVDVVGQWMGFALGDYDSDEDLDVFVTNIGYHPLTRRPVPFPGADCAYTHQFDWGTCLHFLLRNDGIPGSGTIPQFTEVTADTQVEASGIMPPLSLDPVNIYSGWEPPSGLAAYDFGFGTAFFDYENDGDQDLYWLGALVSRGEGPGGLLYPGAGRLMRGDGMGGFEDITVEARLLDIQDVDYSTLDTSSPEFDARAQRIGPEFHENGKGLAKGDLNGDGFVDLIATNSSGDLRVDGGVRFTKGPLFVWLNGGRGGNWLTIRLKGGMAIRGTGSNADGIGARVFLTAKTDGESATTQVQEALGSSTFLSMNSLDMTFGLGEADRADEIVIRWPSGVTQRLESIEANQVIIIEEPEN